MAQGMDVHVWIDLCAADGGTYKAELKFLPPSTSETMPWAEKDQVTLIAGVVQYQDYYQSAPCVQEVDNLVPRLANDTWTAMPDDGLLAEGTAGNGMFRMNVAAHTATGWLAPRNACA